MNMTSPALKANKNAPLQQGYLMMIFQSRMKRTPKMECLQKVAKEGKQVISPMRKPFPPSTHPSHLLGDHLNSESAVCTAVSRKEEFHRRQQRERRRFQPLILASLAKESSE
jgi:hypothetical protein